MNGYAGLSARAALRRALSLLIEKDASASGYNALAELDPDCVYTARALDRKPACERGLLFGEPVLLKDNINTAGKTHTCAGSLALSDHFAGEDAFIVKRIRQADALILGKANMTEFANYVSGDMPNGFSSRCGQVKSPHTDGDPGGSSSGSGAAVGGGIVDMAIGTETMGSILSPAQSCGAVGVKPTAGLVSRTGILPISTTLDTAGPIAISVRKAARLLRVISGADPEDVSTYAADGVDAGAFETGLDENALSGARIGISRAIEPSKSYAAVFSRLRDRLARMGAELIEIKAPETPWDAVEAVMRYEFRTALDAYLSRFGNGANLRTLEDVVKYDLRNAKEAAPYGQGVLLDALSQSGRMREPEYLRALILREDISDSVCEIYAKERLDAVVCASGWSGIAPFCGLPYGTVPLGEKYQNGEPAGCALVAAPFEDAKLLSLLYALETDIRKE